MRPTRGIVATVVLVALAIAPSAGAAEAVPGELIVRFEGSVGPAAANRILAGAEAEIEKKLSLAGLRLAEVEGGEAATRDAIAELERDPDVAYAEPNFIRRLDATPNDQFYGELWALENSGQAVRGTRGTADADIDAAAGWDAGTSSGGIEVAVIDDGISYPHPDLAANVWENPGEAGAQSTNGVDDDANGYVDDQRGWDFADGDSDPAPVGADGDHGTHVAGTIGAIGDNGTGVAGVAWQTEMMALRVFDAAGNTTTAKIVDAFRYATRNGAEIVNGSFGGGGFAQSELDAIRAGAPGTLFVVAAGNDGSDNDAFATYPCSYPAQNVLCVAATGQTDSLASFSNYGATSVDLAAPGVNILSTYPEVLTPEGYLPYAYMSGTSMATPVTAGAAALVRAEMGDPTAGDLAQRLRATVDPAPALAGKVSTGGRLNLAAAVAGATAPPPSPPPEEPAPAPAPPPPEPEPAPPVEEQPEPVPTQPGDATPPETELTAAPAARSADRTPTFRFRSSEPGSGFRCSFDRRAPKPCASPFRPGRVARGRHRFAVTAVDAAGNEDPTPATARHRVQQGGRRR